MTRCRRLLRAAGAEVGTEYYFNDAGSQIDRFARSLYAAAKGEPAPEDGYGGAYIAEIATAVLAEAPGRAEAGRRRGAGGVPGRGRRADVRRDQGSRWTSSACTSTRTSTRRTCTTGVSCELALDRLREQGHVFEADGATWLRTTDFGDDKDRVLRKSDGDWTYFAADCAYYLDKRERGFDRVVIMLGADHHGYIGRMKAMAACFGDDPAVNLEILIGQLVNLVRDGEPLRMSKRAGTVVTLEDFVDALGVDAARYALARYSVGLADRHRHRAVDPGQPRQPGLLRAVRRRPDGVRRPQRRRGRPDPGRARRLPPRAARPREGERPAQGARRVSRRGRHRRRAARAAPGRPLPGGAGRAPTTGSTTTAGSCRVGDEPITDLHRARLWLNDATRTVIANGLRLLGVSAPERM